MFIFAKHEYHLYRKNSVITYYETVKSHPRRHYSYTIGTGCIVARSLDNCYRGNAKIRSICIVSDLHVAVNNEQDRQCTYKCNTDALPRINCCRGKAIRIEYSECVSVALVIQHAERMSRIILSSVACLAVPYCSTLFHKR